MKYVLILLILSGVLILTIGSCDCDNPTGLDDRPLPEDAYEVAVYDSLQAFSGTTLFPDNHDANRPRVVEVDMTGDVVWSYNVPAGLKPFTNPGFDVERLENGRILLVFPGWGILEIDRAGHVMWNHQDAEISHDADRLPNLQTLYVFGNHDSIPDLQVKRIDYNRTRTWNWAAASHYLYEFQGVMNQGWTHTNAVSQLDNGNVLVCLRNFHLIAEVAYSGDVVNEWGRGILHHPHDPEWLPNGNILLANQADSSSGEPHSALEFDPVTNAVVWEYEIIDETKWPVRDANRLPNGNTLITCSTAILEVTAAGELVWQFSFADVSFDPGQAAALGFYKAERIPDN